VVPELQIHSHSLKKLKRIKDAADVIKDLQEDHPQLKENKLYQKYINNYVG
jgi:hypothetical protein